MWDLIVSVPDHCLSFYFTTTFLWVVTTPIRQRTSCIDVSHELSASFVRAMTGLLRHFSG